MSRSALLISAQSLAGLLEDPSRTPVILDVRWTLQQPDGRQAFAEGHIPGARYVSMDDELSTHGEYIPATAGRHPLPDFADFQDTVRSWGIGADSSVVVYDDAAGMGAARAWWMLRWAGVRDVRLLDGGWVAWLAAEAPVETGAQAQVDAEGSVAGAEGSHTAQGSQEGQQPAALPDTPQLATMDAQQAGHWSETGVLVDARAPERFRGEVEPMDPVAGHIPGARNRPATANAPGGFWADGEELREAFAGLGADGSQPVGVYCGSGVTACHNAFALALIGQESTLYPASWSGWSADADNPVATGD